MTVLSRIGQRLRNELGTLGLAAVVLLAASLAFLHGVIRPLEEESARLDAKLDRMGGTRRAGGSPFVRTAAAEDKVARFYRFFTREESATDWLARIQNIGEQVGVRMRSADYRLDPTRSRLDRYQISFPVAGTYAQVRAFIENALNDIPVLSLDRVTLRRKRVGDPQVEADVVMTLYLLRGRN